MEAANPITHEKSISFTFLLISILIILSNTNINAQCAYSNHTFDGNITPARTGFKSFKGGLKNAKGHRYYQLDVIAGENYFVRTCWPNPKSWNTYLTVTSDNLTDIISFNDDACNSPLGDPGQSKVLFTAPYTGIVYVLLDTAGCDTNANSTHRMQVAQLTQHNASKCTNPDTAKCDTLYTDQTTYGNVDNMSTPSCLSITTPAEDDYWCVHTEIGITDRIEITLDSVDSDNDTVYVFMVDGLPFSCANNACSDYAMYDVATQKFVSTGNNKFTFDLTSPGQGNYFFVIDGRGTTITYDVKYHCMLTDPFCGFDNHADDGELTPERIGFAPFADGKLDAQAHGYTEIRTIEGETYRIQTCWNNAGAWNTSLTVVDETLFNVLSFNDDYCNSTHGDPGQSQLEFIAPYTGSVFVLLDTTGCDTGATSTHRLLISQLTDINASDCATPDSIFCGQERTGNTTYGSVNNMISPTCLGIDMPAEDDYWQVTALDTTTISIVVTLDSVNSDNDSVYIFLVSGDADNCDNDSCVAYALYSVSSAQFAATNTDTFTFNLNMPAAGNYYLVVDGRGSFVSYNISFECQTGATMKGGGRSAKSLDITSTGTGTIEGPADIAMTSEDLDEMREEAGPSFNVFPNPSNIGFVNLKITDGNTENYTITIINMMGQTVKLQAVDNSWDNTHKLDTQGLPAGMYNVVIENGIDGNIESMLLQLL